MPDGRLSGMAKVPKLKVFRTSIGFHDAYVAAPSRKAALQAWGAKKDLFAAKLAEQVTDPALMKAPLAQPRTVLRESRGSLKEQLAATAADPDRREGPTTPVPKPRRRMPKPSRAALDAIETKLDLLEQQVGATIDDFGRREKALRAERAEAEAKLAGRREKLEAQAARARDAYHRKLATWEER